MAEEQRLFFVIYNKTMKKLLSIPVCVAVGLSLGVIHAEENNLDRNIVEVAADSGSFKTLVSAISAAGLVETLSGDGPFTVFAPTDEAFAKLPEGTLDILLKPENKEKLVGILTYHVIRAHVKAADVKTGEAPTVNGKPLQLTKSEEGVKVNNANVITADVVASNGVIHVIDSVLLP